MIKLNEHGQVVKVEEHLVERDLIVKKLEQLNTQLQPLLTEIELVKKDLADFDGLTSNSASADSVVV